MAVKIEMPKLSDTQDAGVLASWNVEEGDQVESGDVVAEVETDKATMDVEVFDSGTILKIVVDEGTTVPLGGLMAVIGEEGEDISDILEEAGGDSSGEEEEPETEEESKEQEEREEIEDKETATSPESGKASPSEDGRIKASPLARNMAEDQGIDLSKVEGSGPNGRIIKRDIESYEPAEEPVFETTLEDEEINVSQMRKTIAERLSESKYSRPHYYETIDVDAQKLVDARSRINDMIEGKISFNDIVVKACAQALRKHPMVNSTWQGNTILQHGDVNVAIAVAIDEGLMTPVINHTDQKGLEQISSESKDLAEKARNRDLDLDQIQGSSFTVSNMGMFGIQEFTAIINPPNSAILAVGAIRDVPVVEDGDIVPGKRMKMTMSSDHRVVDGATAAQFLQTLQGMLETPLSMLV